MRAASRERAHDATSAATWTLRLLACRILELTGEIDELNQQLARAVNRHTAKLLARPGVGPDCAAALLITAGDNPERLGSEASSAALSGASPVQVSSAKTVRLRLNRGGDRQANAARYRIALSRLGWDPQTRAYLARRIAQGKTRREALRCLIGGLSRSRLAGLGPWRLGERQGTALLPRRVTASFSSAAPDAPRPDDRR